jgi:prepilin-type N-terminal cleavage/methylation domain-containing protein
MRRDRQRGMTLVELLVAMAITSILLVGLANVFFDVTSRYQDWAHRLQTASVGTGLAANLQADSHRYVHCDSTPAGMRVYSIQLCPADATDDAVVTYQVSATAPWVITRQQGSLSAVFMVRSTGGTRPQLWLDCHDNGSTLSGHIHVYALRLPGDSLDPNSGETFSVYYVAPRGTRGC